MSRLDFSELELPGAYAITNFLLGQERLRRKGNIQNIKDVFEELEKYNIKFNESSIVDICILIKASKSSSDATKNLNNKYQFTERQAKAIVDMRLGKLAHLEKIELNQEKNDLTSTIAVSIELVIE